MRRPGHVSAAVVPWMRLNSHLCNGLSSTGTRCRRSAGDAPPVKRPTSGRIVGTEGHEPTQVFVSHIESKSIAGEHRVRGRRHPLKRPRCHIENKKKGWVTPRYCFPAAGGASTHVCLFSLHMPATTPPPQTQRLVSPVASCSPHGPSHSLMFLLSDRSRGTRSGSSRRMARQLCQPM